MESSLLFKTFSPYIRMDIQLLIDNTDIIRYSDAMLIISNLFGFVFPTEYKTNRIVLYQGDFIYIVKTSSFDINNYTNSYLYHCLFTIAFFYITFI